MSIDTTTHAPSAQGDDGPCTECEGRGWEVFESDTRGLEVQRCDSCRALPDDDVAILHARAAGLRCTLHAGSVKPCEAERWRRDVLPRLRAR